MISQKMTCFVTFLHAPSRSLCHWKCFHVELSNWQLLNKSNWTGKRNSTMSFLTSSTLSAKLRKSILILLLLSFQENKLFILSYLKQWQASQVVNALMEVTIRNPYILTMMSRWQIFQIRQAGKLHEKRNQQLKILKLSWRTKTSLCG
jgi:hypothetical protein